MWAENDFNKVNGIKSDSLVTSHNDSAELNTPSFPKENPNEPLASAARLHNEVKTTRGYRHPMNLFYHELSMRVMESEARVSIPR